MKARLLGGIKFCKICGTRILMQGYNPQNRLAHIMSSKQICYECAFWEDLIAYPPEYMEIVGNKCMRIMPMVQTKDKSIILGGKGKKRYFIRPDWSLFMSNDIWIISTIPQFFQKKLLPTATEISKSLYERLLKNNKRCQAIACFDRYKCLRYKNELEVNGAYNKVPAKWKPGNEYCKYFINIDNLTPDERSVNKQI